jgi:Rrf2 family protein
MRVSAKADYAVRAAVELAALDDGATLTTEQIAERQDIPPLFLQKILHELRRAKIVTSLRGREGGHRLARAPKQISVADVLRVIDGPLANVHGDAPEDIAYRGAAEPLQHVWIALRTNMREVLEKVTLADIAGARLPKRVETLAKNPESWVTR